MRTSVTLALALALAACGKSPTDAVDPFAVLTATIEGVGWSASSAAALNPTAGHFVITGSQGSGSSDSTLVLTLDNIRTPGTYPLGVGPQIVGGSALLTLPAGDWVTRQQGAAGEVTITSVSSTRLVGTFHFIAHRGAVVGTRTVTQGVLDVPVTGGGGVAGVGSGHSVTGTVHGTFVAAGAQVAVVVGTFSSLTVTAHNNISQLGIHLNEVTAPGTYALIETTPVRFVSVSGGFYALDGWSSAYPGGGGTVTVATWTASRVTGTFSATVIGYSGSAAGPLTVSGSFDMGIGP